MAKAKKRPAFSISISNSSARPPLELSLNRPLLAVLLLVGAAVVYLAGLSAYNMLSQNNTTNGNDLAFQGSGSVREHEREDQIVQLKNLNTQLQQENSKYKQDIADLDTRVKQLADSIETLKAFAKQLQDQVGGADSSARLLFLHPAARQAVITSWLVIWRKYRPCVRPRARSQQYWRHPKLLCRI